MKFGDSFFLDQRVAQRLVALQKSASFAIFAPRKLVVPKAFSDVLEALIVESRTDVPIRLLSCPIQIDRLARVAVARNFAVRAQIDDIEDFAIHRGKIFAGS